MTRQHILNRAEGISQAYNRRYRWRPYSEKTEERWKAVRRAARLAFNTPETETEFPCDECGGRCKWAP